MRLDAATLAGIVRGAGFHKDQVATATAIAIATSGGNTHFRHLVGLPGAGDLRGLWGVNVDVYPFAAGLDLDDPRVAATCAYDLTRDCGGWRWAPAYRSGAYGAFVEHAGIEATREYDGQPLAARQSVPAAHVQLAHVIDDIHRRHAVYANGTYRRGLLWPTLTV